jgi:hypothetical protein
MVRVRHLQNLRGGGGGGERNNANLSVRNLWAWGKNNLAVCQTRGGFARDKERLGEERIVFCGA